MTDPRILQHAQDILHTLGTRAGLFIAACRLFSAHTTIGGAAAVVFAT
jgi:hypothetical protein